MSIAVRCPAGGHAIRHPDVAVGRVDAPDAVRIQVLITYHILRYIAGRARVVVSAVALARPAVELVEARRVDILILAQARTREAIRLPRIKHIRCPLSVRLTLAFAYDDRRGIAVWIHRDPVFAGLPKCEGEIRRIDLEHVIGSETTHADVQGALRQLQLNDSVVKIENRYAGTGVHADHGPTDLDFSPCPHIRPKAVASSQRTVDRCSYPIVFAGG